MIPTEAGYYWAIPNFKESPKILVRAQKTPGLSDILEIITFGDPKIYGVSDFSGWQKASVT